MQRILEKLVFGCTLLLLASCSGSDNVKKFSKSIPIKGKLIENIEFFTAGKVGMIVEDSLLILQKNESDIINVYNTKNFELLSTFGVNGLGPEEFATPEMLNYILSDSLGKYISVYDFNRRKYTKLNLNKLLKKEYINITQKENIYETNDYLRYFFYKSDSLLLATPETYHRFILFNYDDKNYGSKYIDYTPELGFEISNQLKPYVYRSFVVVNPERKIFAAAPYFLGELNFFDFEGNYLNSSIYESRSNLESNLNKKIFDKTKGHIIKMESKGGYIYALDKNNNLNAMNGVNGEKRNDSKILVFDWDGNPIKEYIIADHRIITSFTYDENKNVFYMYSREEEKNNIVIYDLNEFQ